jgi:hypothetical protein
VVHAARRRARAAVARTLLALSKRGDNGKRGNPTQNTTLRLAYTHDGDVSLGRQDPSVRASVVQCCAQWRSGDYHGSSDYTAQARTALDVHALRAVRL